MSHSPLPGREARCPKCGGVFTEQNLCTYCHAGIRYNGRGFSFHSTPMQCPRCPGEPLYEIHYRHLALDVCIACQGTWFDLGELESLLQSARQDARGGVFEADGAGAPLGATPPGSQAAYIRCPKCETLMNRTNWEKRSGVIVDWCRAHGIWLDAGEIAQVRSWAASTPDGPPPPAVEAPRPSPSTGLGSPLDRPLSSWEAKRQGHLHSPLGVFVRFLFELFR
ncbi:MAG: zf-TFIIB domain-containing protein [Deltaproteobacteria bacterium]|nr:zf-TFIIB domain-containing protein [Deltaproteobacteria bacterium]